MARLYVAILAHDQRFLLADMVGNIHTFVPEAKVVLYNGGRDSALHHGLDVEVCPYSKPLRYGKLEMFALDVMKWLYEERRKYDFLVTLDSDMLFIKPGFPDYLEVVMANSAYMGVRFQEVLPRTTWSTGKGFRSKWKRVWQPILQTTNPFGAYNPGQVFRKEYVDKLMNYEKLNQIIVRAGRSSVPVLEEMIYPTMAVVLHCNPISNPGSNGIKWHIHSPRALAAFRSDPNIFLIHKVSMDLNAPDRRFIQEIAKGKAPDLNQLETEYQRLVSREKAWTVGRVGRMAYHALRFMTMKVRLLTFPE